VSFLLDFDGVHEHRHSGVVAPGGFVGLPVSRFRVGGSGSRGLRVQDLGFRVQGEG